MKQISQTEIDNALIQLSSLQGHKIDIIYDVISNRLRSDDVFTKYMKNVPEDKRNIEDYYIARDSAMFLCGDIGLDTLIGTDVDSQGEAVNISINASLLKSILRRIDTLENEVKKLKSTNRNAKQNILSDAEEPLINQTEAYKYIGCSQQTIIKWTRGNVIPSYRKGNRVYYKKSDLDKAPIVINFKLIK